MRFVDFLRVTVLLSAGAASLLAALCVIGAGSRGTVTLVPFCAGWWAVAATVGVALSRHATTTPPIARLLASAKQATMMPEHRPGATILNRLWPVLVSTIVAGAIAFLYPQVPGIAAGFAIIWALAWRRQDSAVQAIEERDGVTFYVERTSPVRPIELVRMPGFRREVPTLPTTPTT
ncbi:MAG TPA: hypothetical protein VHB30_07575 [Solirubrobacteraceae bacterium]|nr:hypothetical protein [Solirubrobacteraceae bacterium]